MAIHCELLMLVLVLILHGQVHTGKIFGGHEAVAHSRPYMVLLEHLMQNGKTSHCGGFLLNEDFVMTAAHCQGRRYTVYLGLHSFYNQTGVQHLHVEQTFPHEDFDEADYKHDIMLLKLSSKAIFNEKVRPIALAAQGNGSLPTSCTVSGWGRSNKKPKFMSAVLMEANVKLIDIEQCALDGVYCSKGGTGPRQGDSGGALVCGDGEAYGVVSTLSPCPDAPDMYTYTKIPDYRGWINSIMANHSSDMWSLTPNQLIRS